MTKRRRAQIVLENGKPSAVILGIDEYEEILERLEDVQDLKLLRAMRARPLSFRKLDDFLREHARRV